ncbi:methylmalonyl-CoA mutase family protein [Streptomyces sp. NPDC006261]|uniref:methylmalonyl-CoA mutase family protein n=1 Tax=Streptomyces sp. NPDC006261 TaxID=3156739 RepID=UPI0033B05DA2
MPAPASPVRAGAARGPTGSGSPVEAGARHRRLVADGVRELAVAFDPPTRRGSDSDAPDARGQAGGGGVAVDSLDDMRVLFGGVPLARVSTYLAAGAPAAVLVLLLQLAAEEQGVAGEHLRGAMDNDILGEYLGGGGIFPPGPSLRLVADTLAYCGSALPRWTAISVSGEQAAAAGASAAGEVALMVANGAAYVRAAVATGTPAEVAASRLSFSFAARSTLVEEAAAVRAARRIWAGTATELPGSHATGAPPLRLTRRRGAEPRPARADASGGPDIVDSMAHDIEWAARALLREIAEAGGAVAAIEDGFWREQAVRPPATRPGPGRPADPAVAARQTERLAKLRAWRDGRRVRTGLDRLRTGAAGHGNVLHPMKEVLAAGATVGEVCDALREIWGRHPPVGG